jgi:hypothetical protein
MNADRRVKKFDNYEDAVLDKEDVLRTLKKQKKQDTYRAKIKLRPDGTFDVISYKKTVKEEASDGAE